MSSTERLAIVQQEPSVGEIQNRQGHCQALRDRLAGGNIEGGVPLQMCRQGARSIRQVAVEPGMKRAPCLFSSALEKDIPVTIR